MIISELINEGYKTLKRNNIPNPSLDSELLLSSVMRKSREQLLTSYTLNVPKKAIINFNKLINRRVKNEPVAYIFRQKEFWSKNFIVNKNTLIPRPETELLVEKIVKYFKNKEIFLLDIGTGSGCILLTILDQIKKSRGLGLDISKKALDVALRNSKKFNKKNRLKLYNRSIDSIYGYKFDLIVSNPPYICSHQLKNLTKDIIRFEPRVALDGGNDGLDVIKKVIYKSRNILKRKGMLALEIGYGQYRKVSQILKLQGFRNKFLIKDYQNNIRCVLSILED